MNIHCGTELTCIFTYNLATDINPVLKTGDRLIIFSKNYTSHNEYALYHIATLYIYIYISNRYKPGARPIVFSKNDTSHNEYSLWDRAYMYIYI